MPPDQSDKLRVGRIKYLNVLPVYAQLSSELDDISFPDLISGHPSELNRQLASGFLDASPSSAFEYLLHPELYHLLPNAGISSREEVQSVVLATPISIKELKRQKQPTLSLTKASASSSALARILWRYWWELSEPELNFHDPGQALMHNCPALEIGDAALRLTIHPPKGWEILDLGKAWRAMTGLPFVFAVWIVRRSLSLARQRHLRHFYAALERILASLDKTLPTLTGHPDVPQWLSNREALSYWRAMEYGLGPEERAGLLLFAAYCHEMGLIDGVPLLSWHKT